jgi:TRAP-type transport system small permease protein
MYRRLSRIADTVCGGVLVVCNALLVVMTAIIALLVFTRNAMGFSYSWSEELTRFLLVWLSMLGAAVLLRRDDHIRLDILADRLPPRLQTGLWLVLRLLILAFLVILVQQSWLAALARGATRAPALGISLTYAYMAIPVAAVLMIFVTLVGLWGDTRRLLGREVP